MLQVQETITYLKNKGPNLAGPAAAPVTAALASIFETGPTQESLEGLNRLTYLEMMLYIKLLCNPMVAWPICGPVAHVKDLAAEAINHRWCMSCFAWKCMKIADTNSYMTTTGSVADPINDYLTQDSISGAQGPRANCSDFDWDSYYTQHTKPYDDELVSAGKLNILATLDLCERSGTYINELGNLSQDHLVKLHHLTGPSNEVAILRKQWMYCRRKSLVCSICKQNLRTRHRQFWKTLPNGFVLCYGCADAAGYTDTTDLVMLRYAWSELHNQLLWDAWNPIDQVWDSELIYKLTGKDDDAERLVIYGLGNSASLRDYDQKKANQAAVARCSLFSGVDLDRKGKIPLSRSPVEPGAVSHLVPKWYPHIYPAEIINDVRNMNEEDLVYINATPDQWRIFEPY